MRWAAWLPPGECAYPSEGTLRLEVNSGLATAGDEDGDVGVLRAVDFGGRIHFSDAGFEFFQIGGGDEVGFVEDEDVGETDSCHGRDYHIYLAA